MTEKTIKNFINEICSKPPRKNYVTNQSDVYHIDNIWNLDVLDLKDYSPEKNWRIKICFRSNRQNHKIWMENSFKK